MSACFRVCEPLPRLQGPQEATTFSQVVRPPLERGWWRGPTTCTAPAPGEMAPGELLDQILATPVVLCDQVAWSMLGISMAGWNVILSLGLVWLWWRAYASSSASQ